MKPQPKKVTEKNLSYKQWVKTQPCLIETSHGHLVRWSTEQAPIRCLGKIDPHHVVPVSIGGSDQTCVPLCRKHHDEANNKAEFEKKYALILNYEIDQLNREYAKQPKRETAMQKQYSVRVVMLVDHCKCGLSHKLATSKAYYTAGGRSLRYLCPKLGWVKVERRVS